MINRVIDQPVLTTLTLTFGLDLILYNFMTVYYTATPRRVTLDLGALDIVRHRHSGRSAVRHGAGARSDRAALSRDAPLAHRPRDRGGAHGQRGAATLMGIKVNRIYAITFGIGALMAGATGAIFAMVYPVTTNLSGTYLGKAFVVCVIGGLGSVPGALVGGIVLGIIESFAGQFFGPQHALTVGFVLMLILLVVKPTGLTGIKGYE